MFNLRKYSQKLLSRQVKTSLLLIYTLIIQICTYASENNGRGTKAIALSNAFTAISDNVWALNYNPAGLAFNNDFALSVFYAPAQYGLQELKTTAIGMIIPIGITSFGVTAERFGFDLYSELKISIGNSLYIQENISFGISCDYRNTKIEKYGSMKKIIINTGIIASVAQNLTTGFSLYNIARTKVNNTDEALPQIFNWGICWSPIEFTKLTFDIEKDIRYEASIKIGAEHIILDMLSLRCGIANNPDKYSVGFAFSYNKYEFSYAGYSHTDLGWTHQIEISFYSND